MSICARLATAAHSEVEMAKKIHYWIYAYPTKSSRTRANSDMQDSFDYARRSARRMLTLGAGYSEIFSGTWKEHDADELGEPIWSKETAFKPIAKERSGEYFNFWISPGGKTYPISYYQHLAAEDWLVRHGEIREISEEELAERGILFQTPARAAGWLQVSTEPRGWTAFVIGGEPTQKQIDAVFDIVLAHKKMSGWEHEQLVKLAMKWIAEPESNPGSILRPLAIAGLAGLFLLWLARRFST